MSETEDREPAPPGEDEFVLADQPPSSAEPMPAFPAPSTPSEGGAPAEGDVIVPPPDSPPATPADPQAHGIERLRNATAGFLAARSVGPRALATAAVLLACLAAACFLVHHPGLGGVLGLLALLASELSLAPGQGATKRVDPVATALVLPVDLVLVSGMVAEAARLGAWTHAVLGLGLLLVFAWLPRLESLAAPWDADGTGAVGGLWSRVERVGVLLVGAALGEGVAAGLIVVTVGGLDVWSRLERLARGEAPPTSAAPTFLLPLLDERGALVPLARWGSLALALLLLLVLSRL